MNKLVFGLIAFASISAFAGNTKHGFGASSNYVYSNYDYFPTPSFSFYIIKDKAIHEISAEYSLEYIRKENEHDNAEFGICYSYLLYLGVKWALLGPSVGLVYQGYEHNEDMINKNKSNLCFLGFKSMLKTEMDEHISLFINYRLLAGRTMIENTNSSIFNNSLGIGAIAIF
jgi:hypothetical protein